MLGPLSLPIGRRGLLALLLPLLLAACGKRGSLRRPESEAEGDGRP